MATDNDKPLNQTAHAYREINHENDELQDELEESDSRASQRTLINTESIIENEVTKTKNDENIKIDLEANEAPSEVQLGQCSYISNKFPLVVAVTHLDNTFNIKKNTKATIYGINRSYDIMQSYESTGTLFDGKSVPPSPDCISQNTLMKANESLQSTATLVFKDINSPKCSYRENVNSNTLTFTNNSQPKYVGKSLHNIKSVTFNTDTLLNSVINYQNTSTTDCNDLNDVGSEPTVIVTLPKSILNKQTLQLSEQHTNLGDNIVDQGLLSNIWHKSYAIQTKQFFNKNITMPDNTAIKEMIKENTNVTKRSCADEFRSGVPTDIPELWERFVTVLDNAFQKLEGSISQKIFNDIKNLQIVVPKPLSDDSKIEEVELLSIATDTGTRKFLGKPIQCDLIQGSIIDELTKKHYFDEDRSLLSPDSIQKVLEESKSAVPYTTETATLSSSVEYTEVEYGFPMNKIIALGNSMRSVKHFCVMNFYLFAGTTVFFTFVIVVYIIIIVLVQVYIFVFFKYNFSFLFR